MPSLEAVNEQDNENSSDIVNMDNTIQNIYDLTSTDVFPSNYMNSLITKWKNIFNAVIKTNKNVSIINACLDTETFVNCHGVKFNTTHFTYNKKTKEFQVKVTPMQKQDILCFKNEKNKVQDLTIEIKSVSLFVLFTQFFENINRARFCSQCGTYCHTLHFYPEHDMCETCLFAEIACSVNTTTETCSICHEEMHRFYTTPCDHHFHRKCLTKINSLPYLRCPLCRTNLDKEDDFLYENSLNNTYIA
jgi:hypothetical protein